MMDGIAKIAMRLLSGVLRLRIGFVDDSGAMQRLQVRLNALQTIDGVPYMSHFGFSGRAPVGSDALVAFVGGDRGNGVVLGTNHPDSRPRNLIEGEAAVYNQVGIRIYLSNGGLVIEAAGLPVSLNNAPTVTINASTKVALNTPELDVSGKITAGGDITDNAASDGMSMATMRTIYNAHEHTVEGVQTGLNSVVSKNAIPTM
ncbi:baseplate assembly protein [Herbaspirillum sp. RU 5E]|nr:baseplate assembly protein [Herbaspirillum sp. RU 5E]